MHRQRVMVQNQWQRAVWILAVLALVAASCGNDSTAGGSDGAGGTALPSEQPNGETQAGPGEGDAAPAVVPVADRTAPAGDPSIAGSAVTEFGFDLFSAARSAEGGDGANLTVSPASVAIALAMLEPGTVGDARQQLHDVLNIDDPAAFHAAMNALEQDLEARTLHGADDDAGELTVRIANAAYLQRGYPFEPTYLEAVGSSYGPVLNEVDFVPDPDAVAHEINRFVADATSDRITYLIADGVIDPATVLALVNALYLKASWLEPFQEEATADHPFTLLDGSGVTVEMMTGESSVSSRGDGWVGATKHYTGGLYAQFILPDEGRFDEIAGNLPTIINDYDQNLATGGRLGLPKLETRFSLELSPVLQSLGLTAPYGAGGLLGIANDPRLVVDKVIHETFVAIDEEGTEAAAATAILAKPASAAPEPPPPVILDRPFLYRIVDAGSGATLFIGQVLDPAP